MPVETGRPDNHRIMTARTYQNAGYAGVASPVRSVLTCQSRAAAASS
jgi:hypothetical protein